MTEKLTSSLPIPYEEPPKDIQHCRFRPNDRRSSQIARALKGTSTETNDGTQAGTDVDIENEIKGYRLLLFKARVAPIDIHTGIQALKRGLGVGRASDSSTLPTDRIFNASRIRSVVQNTHTELQPLVQETEVFSGK